MFNSPYNLISPSVHLLFVQMFLFVYTMLIKSGSFGFYDLKKGKKSSLEKYIETLYGGTRTKS